MPETPAPPASADAPSPSWFWIVGSDSISGSLCFFEVPANLDMANPIRFRRACAMAATREGPALKKWNAYGLASDPKAEGFIRLTWWLPAHADAVANCRQLWGEANVLPAHGALSKILQMPPR